MPRQGNRGTERGRRLDHSGPATGLHPASGALPPDIVGVKGEPSVAGCRLLLSDAIGCRIALAGFVNEPRAGTSILTPALGSVTFNSPVGVRQRTR